MVTLQLKSMIREAGACSVGIARLQPVAAEVFEAFQRWLAAGNHAGMNYLAHHTEIRRNPALLLANGEDATPGGSIISIAFPYFSGNPYRPGKLRFARYALGDDYHEVLRQRLRPVAQRITAETGCEARICIDTAPILERYWAQQAGIGFIGQNHQLIIPGIGSHIFLAEIVTRAEFTPDSPNLQTCLNCDACRRACSKVIGDGTNGRNGKGFDARRCNSYLTIEHRGELPADLSLSRGRIYGCDLCLEACPLAKGDTATLPEFEPREALLSLSLEELRALTPERYALLFRHSPIKRAKLAGLLRNAEKTELGN